MFLDTETAGLSAAADQPSEENRLRTYQTGLEEQLFWGAGLQKEGPWRSRHWGQGVFEAFIGIDVLRFVEWNAISQQMWFLLFSY